LPLALWQGTHGDWLGVRTLKSTEIEIFTGKPHPINADGEIELRWELNEAQTHSQQGKLSSEARKTC